MYEFLLTASCSLTTFLSLTGTWEGLVKALWKVQINWTTNEQNDNSQHYQAGTVRKHGQKTIPRQTKSTAASTCFGFSTERSYCACAFVCICPLPENRDTGWLWGGEGGIDTVFFSRNAWKANVIKVPAEHSNLRHMYFWIITAHDCKTTNMCDMGTFHSFLLTAHMHACP